MPLEFSNKALGVKRLVPATGDYDSETKVDKVLGKTETGITSLHVGNEVTRFTFDAIATRGAQFNKPIEVRATYGVVLEFSSRESGWKTVSGEIRKNQKVYIQGNYLNQKK